MTRASQTAPLQPRDAHRRWRDRGGIGAAVIVGVGLVLLWRSWGKWLNPVVDFGRELYVPWQISAGKQLYTELAYFNGPLSPHLNALAMSVLGVSLKSLVTLNLVVLAAVVVLLYRLMNRLADRFTATWCCLVFLVCSAFADPTGSGTYNFVAPYSHEMTHGFLFALLALSALANHLDRPSIANLLATGLATGLAFLTKTELFVAIAPAVALGLAVSRRPPDRSPFAVARNSLGLALAVATPVVAAYLALLATTGPTAALRGFLGPWPHALRSDLRGLQFYRGGMGLLDVGAGLGQIAVWLMVYAILFLPVIVIARRTGPTAEGHRRWLAVVSGLGVAIVSWLLFAFLDVLDVLRPASAILVTLIAVWAWRGIRQRAQPGSTLHRWMPLVAALFSLALLLKVFLRVRLSHYGFVLAAPTAVLLTACLLRGIPAWIEAKHGDGRLFRVAACGFLVALMSSHFLQSEKAFRAKIHPVGQQADRFYADEAGVVIEDTLERLRASRRAEETLAVLPEGVMLNYLLRVENPTPFFNFMPPELIMFGEDVIVDALRRNPPDLIVMTGRGASEYGYPYLGRGYGEDLADWVRQSYRLVERVEGPNPDDPRTLGWTMILRSRTD